MDFAAQKRAAAAYQVASFETDFSQRPQELGPKPYVEKFPLGAVLLSAQVAHWVGAVVEWSFLKKTPA